MPLHVDTLGLDNLAADPAAPDDGYVWYNTTSGELKARVAGVTEVVSPVSSSPWTLAAGVISPTVLANDVAIGTNTMSGTEVFRVNGDALFDNRISMPLTTSSSIGVVYIDTTAFLHGFEDPTTDGQNVFVGGAGNFGLGGGAAFQSSRNVGVGTLACQNIDLGFGNMGVGNAALRATVDGFNNVAIGVNALTYNVDGFFNLAFGEAAGRRDITNTNVTGPQRCVFVGSTTRPSTTSPIQQILIGASVDGRENYSFVIGSQDINTGYLTGDTMIMGVGDGGVVAAEDLFLRGPDVTTGGAGNVVGTDFTISAGLGTGTGDTGRIILQTPREAAAGDNLQTRSDLMVLDVDTVYPGTTGDNLGSDALRWDAYLTNVDINGTITIDGNPGLNGTYTFGGGGSGDIATMTFTDGLLTGVTTVP